MPVLPKQPLIYEINTWVWLAELSRKYKSPITLSNVPPEEWESIASFGFDAVWLMGVWQRSPAGTKLARGMAPLLEEYRKALPDFTPDDIPGSPYCIRDYTVDAQLGGPEGLYGARTALADCGLGLILDFVPNHVAMDHDWILEHPEFIIQGDATDLIRAPREFFQSGGSVFAFGRDPNYPPWPDVAQLNAFHPGLREAAIGTLLGIASQCDGVRCDMSILLINRIFQKTWGSRAGKEPQSSSTGWRSSRMSVSTTPTLHSSQRPIGIWNGNFNSRASITATTSASTTVSSMSQPKRSAFTFQETRRFSTGSSASSRITTSREPRRHLHRRKPGQRQWSSPHFRGQGYFTTASSRGAR